ncbi:GGDEF domain-containing protein [Fredinandcohnia humi]
MLQAKLFDISLFLVAILVAFFSKGILIENTTFIRTLLVYWVFSILYYHLRVVTRKNNTSIDYGISYSISFALFTGPIGLLLFETVYRFSVFFYKKWTKTADPDELSHTFYNIGSFVLSNSIAYYLFQNLYPFAQSIPFGFYILIFVLVTLSQTLTGIFLSLVLLILKDIKTIREASKFVFETISFLDIWKSAITNGLLFVFLLEGNWEVVIMVFILNYIVSTSFYSKAQSIQDKNERDKFEQMAYTDFLTGVSNRALMNKRMKELNESDEYIGIVVADIDNFKKINDTYNHVVGDLAIKHFADSLKQVVDTNDYLFRSGGEEFTIFLRNKSYEQCIATIEKVKEGFANNLFEVEFESKQIKIPYTASFGLYYFKTNDTITMEKAYISADHLLLDSKQLGKNKLSAKIA